MAEGAVTSLVGKVFDTLFGKATKEISYMWNWSKNVEDLENENKKLTRMRRRILQKMEAAKENGDRLLDGVEEWVGKAESHINEAKTIIEAAKDESHISEAKEVTGGANADSQISEAKEDIDGVEGIANKTCFNLGMCVNPGTCYSYGKKAANMAPLLKTVREDGNPFEGRVFVPTLPPGILDLYESKNIDDFETHKSCFKRIMESIIDDTKQIVGIYGIGGVGKTTLAKEVAVSPTVKSLFAEVKFITVSQTVDAKRIKEEVEVAAKRIMNGEKILVILDDMWEELKLDELGIPCGNSFKNCKILLTSRSEDVCKTMNAGLISVDTLPTQEAWILFKRVVGDTLEKDQKLEKIAKKVVDGCGGLPLILKVVGSTLKNESIESWRRARRLLQNRKMPNIDRKIRLAYSHLQLSYDFLESEDAKSCFLLCSMFPEDYDIPLRSLVYYGAGLEIFKDVDSMEDARDRVRSAVKILKSTCLLLDGKDESTVKMHDVVREVALLIASKGSNKFLVMAGIGLKEWEPRTKTVKSFKGISLMENGIEKLPNDKLKIPLDIFLIQGNRLSAIPDEFILGVRKARVLDFGDNNIVALPPSMKPLTKLCVLNLGGNKNLRDISILGDLKSLEILILSNTGIVEISQEIGNLVNLRRLEVKYCYGLTQIARGVISKLRLLEELHIAYYPVEDGNDEGLMEIGQLSMLTFLDLFVPHAHLIPKGACFTNLKGFVIQIGEKIEVGGYIRSGEDRQLYEAAEVVHKKTLILGRLDITRSMLQVKEWIELSDGIIFYSVDYPKNIVPTMYCESMDGLTTILLAENAYESGNLISLVHEDVKLGGENTKKKFFSKLEHLFLLDLTKLQVLWKCPDEYISLENLLTLEIHTCGLKRLFSVNAARGLVNLQTLKIEYCFHLVEVIWDVDGGDNEMVVFHSLVEIELRELENLENFYCGEVEISYPALEKVTIDGVMVAVDKWDNKGKNCDYHRAAYTCGQISGIAFEKYHVKKVVGLIE